MPEVLLQPSEIVELDDHEVVSRVRRCVLVPGAVRDSSSDAYVPDGRDLVNGALEGATNTCRSGGDKSGRGFISTRCDVISFLIRFVVPLAREAG